MRTRPPAPGRASALRRLVATAAGLISDRVQPRMQAFWSDFAARSAPEIMMRSLVCGAWASQAVGVAARLGIPDLLKDGPMTPSELARATGAHESSLARVLRALTVMGVFTQEPDGRIRSTRLSRYLERDAPGSLRALALFITADWHWRAWGNLQHTVETGEGAFQAALGREPYAYFVQEPGAGATFDAAMQNLAWRSALATAVYDFAGVRSLVDVGGGQGMVLAAILKAYPGLRGVLFDMPDVVERARPFIQASGLGGRCDLVGGDFLQDVPAGHDIYVLSSIVHNWDDERATAILAACHRAMRPDSRLLLIEHVIPTDGRPTEGKFLDLEMLVLFSGGRERTAAEYRALLARAGFRLARIIPTVQSFNVLEARRA